MPSNIYLKTKERVLWNFWTKVCFSLSDYLPYFPPHNSYEGITVLFQTLRNNHHENWVGKLTNLLTDLETKQNLWVTGSMLTARRIFRVWLLILMLWSEFQTITLKSNSPWHISSEWTSLRCNKLLTLCHFFSQSIGQIGPSDNKVFF